MTLLFVFFLLLLAVPALAQTPSRKPPGGTDVIPLPTLGGKQFWTDLQFFHQWRIQRHALTGECRLLDEHNVRHAWGTLKRCRRELEKIKRRKRLPPMQGEAVLVLHGLIRSRASMAGLCDHLEKQGGYQVFNVSYSSTRLDVASHAAALNNIMENLDGIESISMVGHSMGNIVIRYYLGDTADRPDPRLKRIVMLAPPNQGSLAALAFSEVNLFSAINGTPGLELGRDWDRLEPKLATPGCAFGILAGGCVSPSEELRLAGLDAGATTCVETSRSVSGPSCSVVADPYNEVAESDETNNTWAGIIPMLTPPPICTVTPTPTSRPAHVVLPLLVK